MSSVLVTSIVFVCVAECDAEDREESIAVFMRFIKSNETKRNENETNDSFVSKVSFMVASALIHLLYSSLLSSPFLSLSPLRLLLSLFLKNMSVILLPSSLLLLLLSLSHTTMMRPERRRRHSLLQRVGIRGAPQA